MSMHDRRSSEGLKRLNPKKITLKMASDFYNLSMQLTQDIILF
jgi:hypothetical protein